MNPPVEVFYVWDSPTIFISDLHINGGPRDQVIIHNIKSLFNPTQGKETGTQSTISNHKKLKRLVILGDIFDFNLAYSHTIYQKHFAFYMCLKELVTQGIEVFAFTGNHDPEKSIFLEEYLGVRVVKYAIVVQMYDSIVRLEHGDLLEPKFLKRSLCKLVRSPLVCHLARFVPANLLWFITAKWGTQEDSHVSQDIRKAQDQQRKIYSVIKTHWPKIKSQGIHYWPFGHFHQAIAWSESIEQSNDEAIFRQDSSSTLSNKSQVFVLGDQVHLHTYLCWDKSGPNLRKF